MAINRPDRASSSNRHSGCCVSCSVIRAAASRGRRRHVGRGSAPDPAGTREPSAGRQRDNLAFATRAVEALEDPAGNVAAIRQRLKRTDPQAAGAWARGGGARPE